MVALIPIVGRSAASVVGAAVAPLLPLLSARRQALNDLPLGGVADLCDSVLHFYEVSSSPGASTLEGSLLLRRLASDGAFDVMQSVFLLFSADNPGLTLRVLRVLSATVRVGMAAGEEPPQEAEAAFDRMGGLRRLADIVGRAAAAGDSVVLEEGMKAMAGVRLHNERRVKDAKICIPLLVALMAFGRPIPQFAYEERVAPPGGVGDEVQTPAVGEGEAVPQFFLQPVAINPLTMHGLAAGIVSMARALEVVKWSEDDCKQVDDILSNGFEVALIDGPHAQLSAALASAGQPVRNRITQLPLWEAVLLCGALRSI